MFPVQEGVNDEDEDTGGDAYRVAGDDSLGGGAEGAIIGGYIG